MFGVKFSETRERKTWQNFRDEHFSYFCTNSVSNMERNPLSFRKNWQNVRDVHLGYFCYENVAITERHLLSFRKN